MAHDLASVSVVHASAAEADALATALFVLGPEHGTAWADAHGVAAWFVAGADSSGAAWREWPTAALAPWLE